ncbi:MAG: Ig-like domain-containing protein, partial [Candidatus Margulisiibacteriota bacterium]
TLSGINPNSGTQGANNLSVVLTGTNILAGATAAFSGTGITINSTTVNSATQATLNVNIAASAATGNRTLSITNPGAAASNTVTFTVNASGGTNHAPVASDVTVSTASNTAAAVNFSATDADGNSLTYSLVSNPTHGTLGTISGNQVTYTPAAGYVGTDSFTYRAYDSQAYSNVGTVSITVTNGTPGPVDPIPSGTAPIINNIYRSGASATDPDRAKGPAGVRIVLEGTNFRDSSTSASRAVEFTSLTTSALTEGIILSWTTTSIEVILPAGLASGMYGVDVKVSAPSAADPAVVTTFVSTPKDFLVTASAAGDIAQIYPNPFSPRTEQVNIVVSNTGSASRLGYYIYDMAAQLVYRTSTGTTQITWNGIDQWGSLVSDGAYILRVVNEDTKSLIAKGKILVVKR